MIDQTPSLLIASTKTTPDAFGPVAEKFSAALPDAPLMETWPNGVPVEIGLPSILFATGLASSLATAIW